MDRKINALARMVGVKTLEDWIYISPESVLVKPNVGQKSLDYLRLWLANQGLTLREDKTPLHWQQTLSDEGEQQALTCPFTILIDSQEKHPFVFTGLRAGATHNNRPIIVPTQSRSLGPSHGDYSILGYERAIHIERKSLEDAHGTILGWGEHRERFERTLEFLNSIEFGAVVIECTLGDMLSQAPSRGKKSAEENKKILNQQYLAWLLKYSTVKWIFCDTRGLAEIETFRLFEKFVAYKLRTRKEAEKRSQENSAHLALL